MSDTRLTFNEALYDAAAQYFVYEFRTLIRELRAEDGWSALTDAQKIERISNAGDLAHWRTDQRFDEYDFDEEVDEPNPMIPDEERMDWGSNED